MGIWKIQKKRKNYSIIKNKVTVMPYLLFLIFYVLTITYTLSAEIFTPVKIIESPKSQLNIDIVDNELFNQKRQLFNYIQLNSTLPFEDALVLSVCIVDFATQYNLDYRLVCAVARTESGFNHKQINFKNCFGLLQIRPHDNYGNDVWYTELKKANIINHKNDLLDPIKNTNAGCYILNKYKNLYGTWYSALSHYSGKENNLEYNSIVMNYYNDLGGGRL